MYLLFFIPLGSFDILLISWISCRPPALGEEWSPGKDLRIIRPGIRRLIAFHDWKCMRSSSEGLSAEYEKSGAIGLDGGIVLISVSFFRGIPVGAQEERIPPTLEDG
ncbi:hypothetical protein TNCV_841091 [Trichonephila clavipes]|nr:hypothetical protein TNCV_841091 [Trichonephila clavipes]